MTPTVEKVAKPLIIKVCGMRDPQNIADLIQLPIDYIGFIFYEKSPRYVTSVPDFNAIDGVISNHPVNTPMIKKVGVFVNADMGFVIEKIKQFDLDVVQLHGKETPQYLSELNTSLRGVARNEAKQKNEELKAAYSKLNTSELTSKNSSFIINHSSLVEVWKAFSVDETFDFETTKPYEHIADKFLFDTKTPQHGGSGQKFDWNILTHYAGETPFFLSGGISAADTEGVKKIAHPQLFGLDINSKFEIAPALKDIGLLKTFIDSVRLA